MKINNNDNNDDENNNDDKQFMISLRQVAQTVEYRIWFLFTLRKYR